MSFILHPKKRRGDRERRAAHAVVGADLGQVDVAELVGIRDPVLEPPVRAVAARLLRCDRVPKQVSEWGIEWKRVINGSVIADPACTRRSRRWSGCLYSNRSKIVTPRDCAIAQIAITDRCWFVWAASSIRWIDGSRGSLPCGRWVSDFACRRTSFV